MRRLRAAAALVFAALVIALTGGSALADHETRDQALTEGGVDYVLVAIVLAVALIVLAAFAAAIVMWERRDAEAEAEQRMREHEEPAPQP